MIEVVIISVMVPMSQVKDSKSDLDKMGELVKQIADIAPKSFVDWGRDYSAARWDVCTLPAISGYNAEFHFDDKSRIEAEPLLEELLVLYTAMIPRMVGGEEGPLDVQFIPGLARKAGYYGPPTPKTYRFETRISGKDDRKQGTPWFNVANHRTYHEIAEAAWSRCGVAIEKAVKDGITEL